MTVTAALAPLALLIARLNVPAIDLTETNWSRPNSVLSKRMSLPETVALTPVACLTARTAATTLLTVVPEAKESCSAPALPATSMVAVAPVMVPPLYPTLAVWAEVTT